MVISLYVDDLLVIGKNLEIKNEFKEEMKKGFNKQGRNVLLSRNADSSNPQ